MSRVKKATRKIRKQRLRPEDWCYGPSCLRITSINVRRLANQLTTFVVT
jgi:hypothetical protein